MQNLCSFLKPYSNLGKLNPRSNAKRGTVSSIKMPRPFSACLNSQRQTTIRLITLRSYNSPMSLSGIRGQFLEVTVAGCNELKDTEWISRQDPYVCLEYANFRHRTRTDTDGGKNPIFQEKFVIPLIEGLKEINVRVSNSNSVTYDSFIGEGKVQLEKVLSQGYDDSPWTIQTKSGRYAGQVRLIMHYTKPAASYAPSAPPCGAQVLMYSTPPPASTSPYAPSAPPYPHSSPYAPSAPPYPNSSPYAPSAPPYPHSSPYAPSAPPSPYPWYPPSPYDAPPPAAPYPPTSTYPPPPSSTYPPPQQVSPFYPPGPYSGIILHRHTD